MTEEYDCIVIGAGPLIGNDQAIIAAGEGATAAIDIKKKLLNL